jgi:plastocyanin
MILFPVVSVSAFTAPTTSTINWSTTVGLVPNGPGRSASGNVLTVCKGDSVKWMWSGMHGVVQAKSPAGYNSCALTPGSYIPKAAIANGGTYTVKMGAQGTRYYYCPVGGHCSMGQKVKIVTTKKAC